MKRKILALCIALALLAAVTVTFVACNTDTALLYREKDFDPLRREDASLADGAEYRIMSYNVLVGIESWGGIPVKPRAQMFAEFVKHYRPDVIALQEFDKDWYNQALWQLEAPVKSNGETLPLDYKMIRPKYNAFGENRSPVLYNAEKLDLIGEGFHIYSKADRNQCRVVTWGVFKDKLTGDKFAVTSTHFDFGDNADKTEKINTQIDEQVLIIKQIYEDYKAPVFSGGDFNAADVEGEENYGFYKRLSDKCGEIGAYNSLYKEGVVTDLCKSPWKADYAIDHLFVKGEEADVKKFTRRGDNFFYNALSDHYPIFIDVAIN